MKLSTAIRIGSMTTRQIRVQLTDGNNGRCALGAAMDASGIPIYDEANTGNYYALKERYPILRTHIAGGCLFEWIYRANDSLGLSRDEIADFVEQVENEHDGYLMTGITESKPLELIAMEAK